MTTITLITPWPVRDRLVALTRQPARRLARLTWRRSRVAAMQCAGCHHWHKPRQLRLPDLLCRSCQDAAYLTARARLQALAATRSSTGGTR
jgi:hypothetical protein